MRHVIATGIGFALAGGYVVGCSAYLDHDMEDDDTVGSDDDDAGPGDDDDTVDCPDETPLQHGYPCPEACTGGCQGSMCVIACNHTNSCQYHPMVCPDYMACLVQCGGTLSCALATIQCSPPRPLRGPARRHLVVPAGVHRLRRTGPMRPLLWW